MDPYIGKLLDNRHEILEVIGTGGMARVYKARDHRLNRLVAIKILREDLAQDAEFRRRFHEESQAVAMLSHPNIVAVYDVSRSSDLEYIVMELIDGITLKQYMQRKGNKLNWREALHFITQIVKALGHAHSRGIIHRDIKPHNVMVLRDGSVKVADFGIARVSSSGHSTLTQEALGSVHYISPEQARGSHIDARSDLYSAGVVLYEMITGRLPFEGDTPVSVAIQHINSIPLSPREIDPSIPEGLEAITMRAMAPNPDNRYLTADEMLADLEEFRKNPNVTFDYQTMDLGPEPPDEENMTRRMPPASSLGGESRYHTNGGGRRTQPPPSPPPASRRRRPDPVEEEEEDEDEDDETEGRDAPWVLPLCIFAVLLFVVVVAFFLYRTFSSTFSQDNEKIPVPNVVGYTYEEIMADPTLIGDQFRVVLGEEVEDDAEAGTILEQDPKAETEVVTGLLPTEIKVTVSAGLELLYMPSLSNKEYRSAQIELQQMGIPLSNITTRAEKSDVTRNYVISTTPAVGEPITTETKIELVISDGPEVSTFPMPTLTRLSLERALSTIDSSNLGRGDVKEVYDDSAPAGTVIYQYPAAGKEVTEGTVVNLQVSKGKEPEQEPPSTGSASSAGNPGGQEPQNPSSSGTGTENPGGTAPQNPSGGGTGTTGTENPGTTTEPPVQEPKNVTRTIEYTLPDNGEIVNLQVLMDGTVVHGQDWDTTVNSKASFTVTAPEGKHNLSFFVNGALIETIEMDFS